MDGVISVVLDTGSLTTKAGFAGESFPRCVFPTMVGRFRHEGFWDGLPMVTCGKEAKLKRGISNLTYPVEDGVIKNWDEMEKLWYYTFYKELYVPPEDTRVLLAVDPLVSRKDREMMAEILFETFTVHDLNLVKAQILAVHATGRTTGVVWEDGYARCYAAPVFEGYPLKHAIISSPLNGQKLTETLADQLNKIGYSFTTDAEMDIIDTIKKKTFYIPRDYEEYLNNYEKNGSKLRYTLPDGQNIYLDNERFQVPEMLFQPKLMGLHCPSIVDNIIASVEKCDLEYKPVFFNNVVMSGGTTMIPGLGDRLCQELALKLIHDPEVTVSVDSITSKQYSVWAGGSILGSMPLNSFWVTRQEYEDMGPSIVFYRYF